MLPSELQADKIVGGPRPGHGNVERGVVPALIRHRIREGTPPRPIHEERRTDVGMVTVGNTNTLVSDRRRVSPDGARADRRRRARRVGRHPRSNVTAKPVKELQGDRVEDLGCGASGIDIARSVGPPGRGWPNVDACFRPAVHIRDGLA